MFPMPVVCYPWGRQFVSINMFIQLGPQELLSSGNWRAWNLSFVSCQFCFLELEITLHILAVTVVSPRMGSHGWPFAQVDSFPGADEDPILHSEHVKDLYMKANPNYGGRSVLIVKKILLILNKSSTPQVHCSIIVGQEIAHDREQWELGAYPHFQSRI